MFVGRKATSCLMGEEVSGVLKLLSPLTSHGMS